MADAKKKDDLSDIEAAIEEIMAGSDDEPVDQTESASEEATATPDVEALIAERDELRDRFTRVLADAENARKRSERDRREAEQYGGSKLARDMLPVYDNMKRALDVVNDDLRAQAAGLIEGVELTMRELRNIFEKHGITRISPEIGDTFDPQLHQAMFEAPVPETKSGQIIQVMAEGFLLHDRLLRPAQVGVSSNPG
ncbi:nucleotide exchange factor GrpE [Sinisalibacter lacisalsi]|uniref:Protein GrpE n=1 Tax=Sinisalibacter lacisalsi TaxID=1526570 RepID=A0ABQ1QB02_9RHOB|nr:nucleotide exchange factor GrpE [Sinisalibacter lacisalsi]GGD21435.1 protein GrpE [Sinisalibacter lacisalsi]